MAEVCSAHAVRHLSDFIEHESEEVRERAADPSV
ncbi:MAG: hypothetical protein IT436_13055 [Phycisphaerales bacterium]|nr:hypothetical protein [Phycisphaerales bacterium]